MHGNFSNNIYILFLKKDHGDLSLVRTSLTENIYFFIICEFWVPDILRFNNNFSLIYEISLFPRILFYIFLCFASLICFIIIIKYPKIIVFYWSHMQQSRVFSQKLCNLCKLFTIKCLNIALEILNTNFLNVWGLSILFYF